MAAVFAFMDGIVSFAPGGAPLALMKDHGLRPWLRSDAAPRLRLKVRRNAIPGRESKLKHYHGFTLIETLIATSIMSGSLIAVASIFAFSVGVTVTSQQRATATLLLCEKMEEFRSTGLPDPIWTPGGSINSFSLQAGYFDYASINSDGSLNVSGTNSALPFLRMWQVTGASPRTATLVVIALRPGASRQPLEMIRATTAVASSF